jgi:glycosyltransferase involved in cell wall biosynthesis
MKVLISGSLAMGGVGTQLALLCRLLLNEGAKVTCCATHCHWPAQELEDLKATGVTVHVSAWGGVGALLIWPFSIKRDFDVLYCIGQGRCHGLARRFLAPSGIAVYHEVLGCPEQNSVAAKMMRHMDVIVANSRAVAQEMMARWPEKPVRIIPFLTADRALPEPPRRPPIAGRELRVAYLGRVVEYKGAPRLVREWAVLGQRPPLGPARLDVHGGDLDPATIPRLRRYITEHGLEHRVECHGLYKHATVSEILSRADLVVLPSQYEGLPLVLVEAMQHGVPIVATDVGGTAELGSENPDVVITPANWEHFIDGLLLLATKLRAEAIDSRRLYQWTEARYGFTAVSAQWREAIFDPQRFFALNHDRE